MPIPASAYIKKSSLPQDRVSTHAMMEDIIAVSASQTTAPTNIPLPSSFDTQPLAKVKCIRMKQALKQATNSI